MCELEGGLMRNACAGEVIEIGEGILWCESGLL